MSASLWASRVPIVVFGPALVGAALGLHAGPAVMMARALSLPAIFAGVSLLMLPALYIGAAFLGVAPRAGAMARSAFAALTDTGVLMLGLAPALLFLVAASTNPDTVRILGVLVLELSVLIGLRALFVRLFDKRSLSALALFSLWSIVTMGIGSQLVASAVQAR